MMKKVLLLCMFSFFIFFTRAQTTASDSAAMADVMRSNGKIYVVVAVLVTIFLGLIFYLIRIDKKISGLEKENLTERL